MTNKSIQTAEQCFRLSKQFTGETAALLRDAAQEIQESLMREATMRAEVEELINDRERIDALEQEIKEEPMMIHDCAGASEWPKHPRGLGLLQGKRTLRTALDALRGNITKSDH